MSDLLFEKWQDTYLARERAFRPGTVRTYGTGARHLERWLGMRIWEIETRDARRYLAESDDPPSTKGVTLAALKSFNKFYCLETDEPMNGIQALSAPRVRRTRGRVLTDEETWFIFQAIETPVEARFVYLGCYAGTRINEARDHVEGEIGLMEWVDESLLIMGKGYKEDEIPAHPELEKRKDLLLSVSPTEDQLRYAVNRLRRHSGVDFQGHDLRRTFSHKLEKNSVPHNVKQKLMRHAGDITTHYSGVNWAMQVAGICTVQYLNV